MSELRIERVDGSRAADFTELHCSERGGGWCHCVAWWVPTWEGWSERTAAENRAVRLGLQDRGVSDGYLLYRGSRPVAWCQCGPRDQWPKLREQFELSPSPVTWAVTCFFVASDERRRGHARRLLQAVLAEAERYSAQRIEAFPKRAGNEAGELWNGPERMFLEAGFRIWRDDPVRPVLVREVGGSCDPPTSRP